MSGTAATPNSNTNKAEPNSKPWCLTHNVTLVAGLCPYDILTDFKDGLEKWSADVAGSPKVDEMNVLDEIYTTTIGRLYPTPPADTPKDQGGVLYKTDTQPYGPWPDTPQPEPTAESGDKYEGENLLNHEDWDAIERFLIEFYADWSGYPPEHVHARSHQLEIGRGKRFIQAIIATAKAEGRREAREEAHRVVRKYFTWPPGAFTHGATPHIGGKDETISQRKAKIIMEDADKALAELDNALKGTTDEA